MKRGIIILLLVSCFINGESSFIKTYEYGGTDRVYDFFRTEPH